MILNRRSGGTMNMMNPPPPAPETLPARAPVSRALAFSSSMRWFVTALEVSFSRPKTY